MYLLTNRNGNVSTAKMIENVYVHPTATVHPTAVVSINWLPIISYRIIIVTNTLGMS